MSLRTRLLARQVVLGDFPTNSAESAGRNDLGPVEAGDNTPSTG